MSTDSIKFTSAGGVPDIEIAVSRSSPGLYVLEGANGAGKSQALQGIDDLTTGEKTMRVKHGRRSGSIEGWGSSIHLGGRTTRRGEIDVVGLSSRMDIAAIVDPGFKQRDAANRGVVKALVRMAGINPDPSAFHILMPEITEEDRAQAFTVLFPDLVSDDLVELARKVKDGFDARARIVKAEAERAQGEADALLATGADLDLDQPHDPDVLAQDLEQAVGTFAAVKQRAATYGELERAAVAAKALMGEEGGPTPERIAEAEQAIVAREADADKAAAALNTVAAQQGRARAEVERLDASFAAMENEVAAANDACMVAQTGLAALHESAQGWEAAQEAVKALEGTEAPTDGEVAQASQGVLLARLANEQGVLVRDAVAKRKQGMNKRIEAAALVGREREFRDAGKATDGVLSDMLNDAGIEGMVVIDGEVFATLPGDDEPRVFLDMSDGERTKAALLATIPVVQHVVPEGELGVIVLGQRVYQDLDFESRRDLAEFVAEVGVIVFTALPTEGDLKAVKPLPGEESPITTPENESFAP